MCFYIFQAQYLVKFVGFIENEWIVKTSLECDVRIEGYEMEQMGALRSENETIRIQIETMNEESAINMIKINEAINKNSVAIENVTQHFRIYAKKIDLVIAAFKKNQMSSYMYAIKKKKTGKYVA